MNEPRPKSSTALRLLGALAIAALGACSDAATGTSGTATASPTTSAAPTASAAAGFGHASCDDYLTKSEACIAKAPEAERATRTQALEATRKAWAESAATPAGRVNLATTCQAALAALDATPCP